jgi:hypothetical protein
MLTALSGLCHCKHFEFLFYLLLGIRFTATLGLSIIERSYDRTCDWGNDLRPDWACATSGTPAIPPPTGEMFYGDTGPSGGGGAIAPRHTLALSGGGGAIAPRHRALALSGGGGAITPRHRALALSGGGVLLRASLRLYFVLGRCFTARLGL